MPHRAQVLAVGALTSADGSALGGRQVVLRAVLDDRVLHTTGTVTTAADGTWSLRFRPTTNATYAAAFVGGEEDGTAVSAVRRLVVSAALAVRSPASGAVSSVRSPLVVTGVLAPGKAGVVVTLYKVTATGRTILTQVRTGKGGAFRFERSLGRGDHRLQVGVGVTPGNGPGSSTSFVVKRR